MSCPSCAACRTRGDSASQKWLFAACCLAPPQILEHAVTAFRPAFVLKTDDDAFVNVPSLLPALRSLCVTPRCRGPERLYVGAEVRHAGEGQLVNQVPGHAHGAGGCRC